MIDVTRQAHVRCLSSFYNTGKVPTAAKSKHPVHPKRCRLESFMYVLIWEYFGDAFTVVISRIVDVDGHR